MYFSMIKKVFFFAMQIDWLKIHICILSSLGPMLEGLPGPPGMQGPRGPKGQKGEAGSKCSFEFFPM